MIRLLAFVATAAACTDGGPWACIEDGCPSPSLDCAALAGLGACTLTFGSVWSTPPDGLAAVDIAERCAGACGRCAPFDCNIDELDASGLDEAGYAAALLAARSPLMIRSGTSAGKLSITDDIFTTHADVELKVQISIRLCV